MSKYFYFLAGLMFMFVISCDRSEEKVVEPVLTNYVDPMIGTGGHGHTYPGATVPFGMLQISPDNGISKWDWCSGYHYSDSITIGFSHLHLSGTGIGDLADIRFMPINKKVDLTTPVASRDDVPYKSLYSHEKEVAEPGYYAVDLLDHNIKAEFSSDLRRAYHRYTYADTDEQSVIIDLGFAINWDQSTDTQIKILDDHTVVGYRHSKGWARNQKVFFAAKFSKPIVSYDLIANNTYLYEKDVVTGLKTFAQLYFDKSGSSEVQAKVSVSSVNIENALLNLNGAKDEWNFDKVRTTASNTWNSHLRDITVSSDNEAYKEIFYTAMYHAQVAPVTFSDVNGEFRLQNDSIVKATEFTAYSTLSLWDTFRAEHPLFTLIEPEKVNDFIQSMLIYYEEHKRLPVWTLYANETNTMTGYHSIPVIVEAYIKGIRNYDVEKAFEAMKKTMMQDDRGLVHYKKYGYIPFELLDESVTITLEYAYNDWCVGQLAKALGKTADFEFFNNRASAYKHLFDAETGFMRGKNAEGTAWHEPFDPKFSSHRVHADYTEGNAWQHSWFVLHDVENLIAMHGGEAPFTAKLEQLFTESSEITGENISVDISGLVGQYAHGNEPSHHIAYMFNFAKKPWRTQYWVREILKTQYDNTPDGLSGNEDCGQMSAWYVFSAMGLYPYSPASGNYQIGSPIFEKSVIELGKEKSFTILAKNASDENIYIQSATLNGQEFDRTWISHEELSSGGSLEFVMGNTPNKNWGITK